MHDVRTEREREAGRKKSGKEVPWMMGKLQTDSGKMNVSGQVYEEPLSFECRAHISRHGPSDISESPNDTLAIQHQQQPVNSKKKPQTLMLVRKTACKHKGLTS